MTAAANTWKLLNVSGGCQLGQTPDSPGSGAYEIPLFPLGGSFAGG
jgi:hypothetical protein